MLVHVPKGSPPYRGGVVCGSSTPGRATGYAKQIEGRRQVKLGPLVLQVEGWAGVQKPEAFCATRHQED